MMDFTWPDIAWGSVTGWIVVASLLAAGLIGTALPILPGTVIAFVGVFVHRLWFGEDSVGWSFVGLAGGLATFSVLVDFIAGWWGAKRFGASRKGAIGALVGGIVGIFFGLPGIVLGPFFGAIAFELIDRRPAREATRAGVGTLIGGLMAFAAKIACTVAIIIGFFFAL
jgi:hypothetical protein